MVAWNRRDLKDRAKVVLRQTYWAVVLVAFILVLVSSAGNNPGYQNDREISNPRLNRIMRYFENASTFYSKLINTYFFDPLRSISIGLASLIGLLIRILIFYPIEIGCYAYFRTASDQPHKNLDCLGMGFRRENYVNIVVTLFKRDLYTFLWFLALIVPGIIKVFAYRQVVFILSENPTMDSNEVLRLSTNMMVGQKFDTFVLDLSFAGWYILSVLAAGIPMIFFTSPYVYLTRAQLYLRLRDGVSLPEEMPVFKDPNIIEEH